MADETKRYDASITNKRRWFGRFPFKQVRCPELPYAAPSFDLNNALPAHVFPCSSAEISRDAVKGRAMGEQA